MSFDPLPLVASWRHEGARAGFEVAFFAEERGGVRVEGVTTATEDGESWIVDYVIHLDESWRTRSARITGRSGAATRVRLIEADGDGHWQVDGVAAPQLQGCLDLDLEASAMTNTFPVHRLRFPAGRPVPAPAAYVRAVGLAVDRLDQSYSRSDDEHYDYAAPEFDFTCRLTYDRHGLILDYPGIAVRVQ
ncbi:putative glycolipid-binding domain-containing protein [Amycolatopsis tucumanensis]|uniref:Glycolipid-binding domain-containing protein n=1 Tax=Amycolatopsis tucumanensis TaxID=401106 RepID=A0ABP7HKB3_9PSEU|nr:putative glycolipid-binding domain-containing protein [Amycolatopsis tucumanensis]MCF6428784.1 putative glycolipid-binding domain-containing protein [Amycolatopsis tucumanensis]